MSDNYNLIGRAASAAFRALQGIDGATLSEYEHLSSEEDDIYGYSVHVTEPGTGAKILISFTASPIGKEEGKG